MHSQCETKKDPSDQNKPSFDWLEASIIALAFTIIRLTLSIEYVDVPFDRILNLSIPRPFAGRILIPLLLGPLFRATALSPKILFGLTECCSALLIQYNLWRIFCRFLPASKSERATRWFLPILLIPLVLVTVLPIYYPWDTPSVLFWIIAIRAVIEERACLFLLTITIASFNRETALLLPLLWLSKCHFIRLRGYKKEFILFGIGTSIVIIIRAIISYMIKDLPGKPVQLYFNDTLRIVDNAWWVLKHPIMFIISFGWTLILLAFTIRSTPYPLRHFYIVAFLLTAIALIAGNAYEPRVFAEAFVILYITNIVGFYSRS